MKFLKSALRLFWLGLDSGIVISISIFGVAIILLAFNQKVWMLLIVSLFIFILARFIRDNLTFSLYSSETKQFGLVGILINYALSVFFVQSFARSLETVGAGLLIPIDYKYQVTYPEGFENYIVISILILSIIISTGVAFAAKTFGFSVAIAFFLVIMYLDRFDISKLPFIQYLTIENITIFLSIYSFLVLYGILKSAFMDRIYF